MSIALKMKNCKAVTNGLSLSSKVAYGCGDAACNVVWGAMSAWLMYYWFFRYFGEKPFLGIEHFNT